MNTKMFELSEDQLSLIAGGIGIGGSGRIEPDVGSPYLGIGGGGRPGLLDPFGGFGSGWLILPGDLVTPLPILKPEPGKP